MFIALATLIFIHFCALITPGPDFFLVSQTAISRSRRDSLMVVAGITLGVMVWAMLALLGLNILFEQVHWLKRLLFVAGGLYLCWLGYQMLRAAFAKQDQDANQANAVNITTLPQTAWRFFLQGFLTNILNPKAVIYFGSVFSLFLNNPALDNLHGLLFVIVSIETFLWFTLVTFVFSLPKFKRGYEKARQWIDGFSGGIFTAFGLYLLGQK
ncbi:threonine efflux protein [Acinetobacter marinus]|uniref:Threonine efflux protein n=1 Tax=Acinetobacter marinus TaxID=281375 RepID=A0A1G6GSE1_9GAMM|nr:LysE family transporter [Acinetobacter marinus]SDB84940.1 threonine efflux protein [Acinetobacter marinus]